MKKLYYKVKYGFGVMDFVSIDETELEKALYAHKFGEVVQLGGKQITGERIIVIEPHYQKYTGWNESYEPKEASDFIQIERDCPKEINLFLEKSRKKVNYLVSTNQRNLIGKELVKLELDNKNELTKQLADKFTKL